MQMLTEKVEALEKRIRDNSATVSDYFKLGTIYLDGGDYNKVIHLYDQIIKLSLSNLELSRVYYEKGEALKLSNKNEKAICSYIKSYKLIQTEANSVDSLDLKGLNKYNLFLHFRESNEGRQHAEEAINYFNLLLKKLDSSDERYFVTLSYLADIYSKLGEYNNALNYYDQILKLSSDNNDIVWALGGVASIYGLRKELKRAEQYFKKAIHKANKTIAISKIYFDMGKMYFENNCFSEADTALRNALLKLEDDVILKENKEYKIDILWYLGTLAYEAGREKDIEEFFKAIMVSIDNNHYYYANIHITLGHFYSIKNNNEKAREHYNYVLSAPLASEEEINMAKDSLSQIPLDA